MKFLDKIFRSNLFDVSLRIKDNAGFHSTYDIDFVPYFVYE